jgi:hypothetical protein
MKNAKLQAALKRRAASRKKAMMNLMATIPENSELDLEDEKNEIFNKIEQGDTPDNAVYSTLVKRHKQELITLAKKHQCENEILKAKTLNEARDAGYLERNKILGDFQTKLQELGTLDMDDDEYDLKEQELQDQLKEALKKYDENIEKQGKILYEKEKQVQCTIIKKYYL